MSRPTSQTRRKLSAADLGIGMFVSLVFGALLLAATTFFGTLLLAHGPLTDFFNSGLLGWLLGFAVACVATGAALSIAFWIVAITLGVGGLGYGISRLLRR